MPADQPAKESVGLRLDIPIDYRNRLRIAAAKRNLSMTACLGKLVLDWIDEVEPRPDAEPPKPRKRKEKAE